MGSHGQQIACRTCREPIPAEAENCPYCGTSVRGLFKPVGALLVGAALVVASLTDLQTLWFYGLIGLVVAGAGIALVVDKRRRRREA